MYYDGYGYNFYYNKYGYYEYSVNDKNRTVATVLTVVGIILGLAIVGFVIFKLINK